MYNTERRYYNYRLQILCNKDYRVNKLYYTMLSLNHRLKKPEFNKWDKVFSCFGLDQIDYGFELCGNFRISKTYEVRELYLKSMENGILKSLISVIEEKTNKHIEKLNKSINEIKLNLKEMEDLTNV